MGAIDRKITESGKFMERGQALTEFAIFGSILLFCVAMLIQYGLEANYQQQAQMEAFRKAQKMAFYNKGPNSSASLTLIKDKPFPDPNDQMGFAERYPVSASASATWNTDQSAPYISKFSDTPDAGDLPAVHFEVNGVDRTSQVNVRQEGKVPGTFAYYNDSLGNMAKAASPGNDNAFGFYTARFEKRPCPSQITVAFEDPQHNNPHNPAGREYFTVTVNKEDIVVMNMDDTTFGHTEVDSGVSDDTELLMSPYFRYGGLKYKITQADVDGDGKLEYIIAVNKKKDLFYIDYHDYYGAKRQTTVYTTAGGLQIDTDFTQVNAWDKMPVWGDGSWALTDAKPEDRQGLIQDSEKRIRHARSKIVTTQENGVISSHTDLNATQRIIHKFRMNDGQVVEIPVEFSKTGSYYNWNNP